MSYNAPSSEYNAPTGGEKGPVAQISVVVGEFVDHHISTDSGGGGGGGGAYGR